MKNKWRNGVTGCLIYWGDKWSFAYDVANRQLLLSETNNPETATVKEDIDFSEVQDLVESLEK